MGAFPNRISFFHRNTHHACRSSPSPEISRHRLDFSRKLCKSSFIPVTRATSGGPIREKKGNFRKCGGFSNGWMVFFFIEPLVRDGIIFWKNTPWVPWMALRKVLHPLMVFRFAMIVGFQAGRGRFFLPWKATHVLIYRSTMVILDSYAMKNRCKNSWFTIDIHWLQMEVS